MSLAHSRDGFTRVTDDLEALLQALPPRVRDPVQQQPDENELIEVVMDLGRPALARFPEREMELGAGEVRDEDVAYVVARIGPFGDDNRAGIERTLHRISAIRNRQGKVIGLTCRVGRAVYGTIRVIEDLVQSGNSILLLGRPGVGKTTMLREVARVLSTEMGKRVVVVDTSNEIAGAGDVPHPAIGKARRMQVTTPAMQHAVMIEAVENHMPQAIIIDEIGTEADAAAARTIAERGVQLIATAHGNTLDNLIMNPTLSDLIGGVQTVTLGDEEARRRGTQKTIQERKAPPTFQVVVEIQDRKKVAVHTDVAETVDSALRGQVIMPEVRWVEVSGEVRHQREAPARAAAIRSHDGPEAVAGNGKGTRVYPFGVSRSRVEQVLRSLPMKVDLVHDIRNADVLLTTKSYYRTKPQTIRSAEEVGTPIYVLRKNSSLQIEQALRSMQGADEPEEAMAQAMREVEDAVGRVLAGEPSIELSPQGSYIRRLQHQVAERNHLSSRSIGKEPGRRVTISREEQDRWQ